MPTITTTATNTRARSARVNRRPHPNLAALKERAFALACTGLRSPAIALQLHVPERTIRRWVNDTLLFLAQDALDPDGDCTPDISDASDASNDLNDRGGVAASANGSGSTSGDAASPDDTAAPATRPTLIPLERHRALAIESQRAIAATTHAAYDRLMARHDDLLDALSTILRDNVTSVTDSSAAPAPLPPAAALLIRLIAQLEAGATRHLRIAQAAHRDAARFQGVTAYAQTDARLIAAEAHAEANPEPDDDAEPESGLVPIKWIDPNDPNEVGLIPQNTFDASAALDDLCNGPTSSLGRLKQTDDTKNHTDAEDDAEDDEQDEDTILAAIIAEQAIGDLPAVAPATPASSTTTPATGPATIPATGPATPAATIPATRPLPSKGRGQGVRSAPPATSLDERCSPYPTTGETEAESEPGYLYEERQRLPEERMTPMECLARARHPPLTLPRSNTIAALFLRNPRHVF